LPKKVTRSQCQWVITPKFKFPVLLEGYLNDFKQLWSIHDWDCLDKEWLFCNPDGWRVKWPPIRDDVDFTIISSPRNLCLILEIDPDWSSFFMAYLWVMQISFEKNRGQEAGYWPKTLERRMGLKPFPIEFYKSE